MSLVRDTSEKICKALFFPDNRKSLVPNWLSFVRAVGGVAIPVLSYNNVSLSTLAGVTVFIAISDLLDGKVARLLNAQSDEGALLDVISDKIFAVFLIIGNIPRNKLFLINGFLESVISSINANHLAIGGSPKSNFWGKVKIWPLSFALAASYVSYSLGDLQLFSLNSEQLMNLGSILCLITIPFEIVNIVQYYNSYKKFKLERQENHICALSDNNFSSSNKKVYTKNGIWLPFLF